MNTATEQVATRDRLSKALRAVRECCHPPLGEASWPSDAQLNELDSAVVGLAMMDRLIPGSPAVVERSNCSVESRFLLSHFARLYKTVYEMISQADVFGV